METNTENGQWWSDLSRRFAKAVSDAIAEHKRNGHPIYYRRKDVAGIVKEWPDGTAFEIARDAHGQEIIIRKLPKQ